ncbi:MAG TPA: class I SAM-dependent methyltransferase [Gemmatimonadaceae bacterium]|nr:class I SAM-dependent methyltransferase [Gemmatimonadaceae bacterium]
MPPIRVGTPDQFAAVRDAARRAGYTEAELARRCEIPSIYRFRTLRDGRAVEREVHDAFGVLLHLFLDEEPLPWSTVRAHLDADGVAALRALGLVEDAPDGERCRATVLLYPTHSLLIASDLTHPRDGGALPADAVYPAITSNTGHFLTMLPETPCDALLELCAGTGVAALAAARRCGHVWATDITERSAHFARFNAALNGIANATAARGDLYAAVAGRTFDRIVAHPPYVAEPEVHLVFRDGGEDGEQVTRGIVRGAPAHLRPGGTLHCTCAVTDRAGRPFERRLREWLGEAEGEFDVFFFPQAAHEPTHFLVERAVQGREPWSTVERRHATFARLEVERIVYGSFVVRRRTAAEGARPPLTVRRRSTPAATGADVRHEMAREAAVAAPGVEETLADAPLAASSAATFALTHALVDGAWQATACHVHLAEPFVVDAEVPPWIAALLVRCDGRRPVRTVVAELQTEGMAPDALRPEELRPLLRAFVGAGILLLPAPSPGAPSPGAPYAAMPRDAPFTTATSTVAK